MFLCYFIWYAYHTALLKVHLFELKFFFRQIETNFTNEFAYFSRHYEIFTNLPGLTTSEYFRPTSSTNIISYHYNNYLLLRELAMY